MQPPSVQKNALLDVPCFMDVSDVLPVSTGWMTWGSTCAHSQMKSPVTEGLLLSHRYMLMRLCLELHGLRRTGFTSETQKYTDMPAM